MEVVGPLSVVEGLYRTTGGGQIYFFSDGSYFYISAAGFSGTDSVEFTAVDSSNAVAGTGTLTINVAATALLPFVSIGTQLGERHVVDAGFPTVGDGIHTSASQPVALTGGGYVITVDYLDQAPGSINQVQTYDANNNLVGTFDPGTFVSNLKTTALTNGDYVVGWDTRDDSGSTLTGHVELFDATGTALAGPVALDLPGGATGITQIAALPGGGFEVLQFASGGTQLFGWSFDAAGVPRREPFAVGSFVSRPALAVLPDGETVLAQVEGTEVHVQRYNALGNPIGNEILPPSDGGSIDPSSMSVTPMPNGGFAVSWASRNGPAPRGRVPVVTHVQLVDADGNLVGNQATRDVTYSTIFGAPHPTVVPLADGGFVIDWRGIVNIDNVNGFAISDVFQAYDASGNAVGGISKFTAQTAFGSVLARVFALPDGGFAVGLADALAADGIPNNLLIYDNNGNQVGDVRLADAGDGAEFNQIFLTNLANGNSLILYHEENGTLVSSRDTVQTIKFDTSTPVVQTGITFNENTTGTIPVVISIPDPDGSEIVQSMDIAGIPAGWTLSDPGGTAVFANGTWSVGGNVAHGGEIDLSLKPPVNLVGSETLTVTVNVVDTGNGSLNQSIPLTFDVRVLAVPADFDGDGTSDVLFRNDASGDTWFEAISNGAFDSRNPIGGSDTNFEVVGTGDFFGIGTSDILFRNNSTGDTWIEAISNGSFNGWNQIGGSDTHYSVVGVGDFFGNGTDDILFRNDSTGDTWFEAISNGSFNGWNQVGGSDTHYSVAGIGDFFGNGTDDILFRNNSTGDTWFEAMSNGSSNGWNQIGGSDTNYSVVGIGDFFGNGTDDILFRNNSTGDTWFEAMSGGAFNGWQHVGGSDTNYSVVANGDYLGNATSDILFRNNSTGDIWLEAISNGSFNGWQHVGGSDPA
jgi:hypothetical protein